AEYSFSKIPFRSFPQKKPSINYGELFFGKYFELFFSY
ncbi:MAG: hypothetical protein ACI81S_001029, partial [Sphingobacteriales bacterium]